MKNQVNVFIYGRNYPMLTDETEEYTQRLCDTLNTRMQQLRAQKPSISIQDAAAVISLECVDELVKKSQTERNIRTQISAYAEDASDSRAQMEQLQKENNALKERVRQLEAEVKLRAQLAAEDSARSSYGDSTARTAGTQSFTRTDNTSKSGGKR
ncbi:MAG: cell division protein ZapA [Ruminococcus sp.]|nr:cell division protein ZapA [Ruminococcus sp.]